MRDIIFDLDGTLIDSRECIFGIYEKLFDELKMPRKDRSELVKYIGPPAEFVLKQYLTGDRLEYACKRFRELYKDVDLAKANKLFDGVKEMLKSLKQNGKRLFIATTKNDENAHKIANIFGIREYFTGICGSAFEKNRLTKVQVIDTLCEEYKIDKGNTILVGDTHYDAEGAEQAGIKCAIVCYGFGDREKLREYDITQYYNTPKEVTEYFTTEE